VTVDSRTTLYEYEILNIPDASKVKKARYMATAIQNIKFLNDNEHLFATDNISKIVSWTDLHTPANEVLGVKGTSIAAGSQWDLITIKHGDLATTLRFKFVRKVDINGLKDYTRGLKAPSTFDTDPTTTALNIMMSKCFDGEIIRLGANKFFLKESCRKLGNSRALCTARGYSYKIRPRMGKILLNFNSVTSAFWKPISLSDAMEDDSIPRHALKGLRVYIDYERGDSEDSDINEIDARIKRIQGFGLDVGKQTFMWTPPGQTVPKPYTVQQYLSESKPSSELTGSTMLTDIRVRQEPLANQTSCRQSRITA
jgi:eukaryotic translation initiation factor 2C